MCVHISTVYIVTKRTDLLLPNSKCGPAKATLGTSEAVAPHPLQQTPAQPSAQPAPTALQPPPQPLPQTAQQPAPAPAAPCPSKIW